MFLTTKAQRHKDFIGMLFLSIPSCLIPPSACTYARGLVHGLSSQCGKLASPPTHTHCGFSSQAAWARSAQETWGGDVGVGHEPSETKNGRVPE